MEGPTGVGEWVWSIVLGTVVYTIVIMPVLTPEVVRVTYNDSVDPTLAGPVIVAIITLLLYGATIIGTPTDAPEVKFFMDETEVFFVFSPTTFYERSLVVFVPWVGVTEPPADPGVVFVISFACNSSPFLFVGFALHVLFF